ncbi:complement activation, classical pathway [Homalodisca vitripennis]|nr:complement activation, classical pathway [Homalodisca vitripennis]
MIGSVGSHRVETDLSHTLNLGFTSRSVSESLECLIETPAPDYQTTYHTDMTSARSSGAPYIYYTWPLCGHPPVPVNTRLTLSNTSLTPGTTASYSCDNGYEFFGLKRTVHGELNVTMYMGFDWIRQTVKFFPIPLTKKTSKRNQHHSQNFRFPKIVPLSPGPGPIAVTDVLSCPNIPSSRPLIVYVIDVYEILKDKF